MLKNPNVDLREITKLRYIDWAITTPLIILVMILFYSNGSAPKWSTYLILVILNYGMLVSGYLGESKQIDKEKGFAIGFIFLALMLIALITCCVPHNSNHAALYFFGLIWSGYGVAYLMNEEQKNLSYNILDVVSKAVFGIILYFYYGKVLKF
jgi:bacteriorhodopsin